MMEAVLATSFGTSHTSTAFTYDTRSTILFSASQRHHAWDIRSKTGTSRRGKDRPVLPLSVVDNSVFSPIRLTVHFDAPYDQEALYFSH